MSVILDTSVIVRYLMGDPPHLAEQAALIVDGQERLLIPEVVLAETAFVLMSVYRVRRESVVDRLVEMLRKANVEPYALDKATVLRALLLCRPSGRVSFTVALTWATALQTSERAVYSFDARFPKEGITVLPG